MGSVVMIRRQLMAGTPGWGWGCLRVVQVVSTFPLGVLGHHHNPPTPSTPRPLPLRRQLHTHNLLVLISEGAIDFARVS